MQAGEYLEAHSEAFDRLTNNPGAKLKVIYMKAGPFLLQLIEYVAAGGTTLDLHHNNVGSPHISLYVADVEAKYRQLKSRDDVTITSDIIQITPNMRSFYTEDPDGVPVEFLQMTE
jgi:catechol 2,3-dioxygenase-like lactoylglutathione lyase family enzyme